MAKRRIQVEDPWEQPVSGGAGDSGTDRSGKKRVGREKIKNYYDMDRDLWGDPEPVAPRGGRARGGRSGRSSRGGNSGDIWGEDNFDRGGRSTRGGIGGKALWIMLAAELTALVVFILVCVFVIWPVELFTDHVTLELGQRLPRAAEDYLDGYSISLYFADVDLSGVKENTVGTYQAYATHGSTKFPFTVDVVDTTAPSASVVSGPVYLARDEYYESDRFLTKVEDASGNVSISLQAIGGKSNSVATKVMFSSCGDKKVQLVLSDPSGNIAKVEIPVTVDTAPEITGMKECYAVLGEKLDLMENVRANDDVDGDLTKQIVLSDGGLDWEKEGDYTVSLTVTDGYGLEGKEDFGVHVLPQSEINRLLACRQIRRDEQRIVGATNLYTAGAAPMGSIAAQEKYMLPSLVHVYIEKKNGWAKGSGFIIDITDPYVYIASNNHVLKVTGKKESIYFYDGTSAEYEVIGANAKADISFARIPISKINPETMKHLQSVSIDQSQLDLSVKGGMPLFMEILTNKGLDYTREGESIGLSDLYSLVNHKTLQTSVKSVPGNSGSAVMDEYGNLISMVVGIHLHGSVKTHHSIPAQYVVEEFKNIVGRELYVAP